MMMTPDDLRALADALDEAMFKLLTYKRTDEAAKTCQRAADYLRACADVKPVAWRCEVRGDGTDPKLGAVGWRHYSTTTSEREAQAFVARCGDGIEGRAVPLYPHTAPAVPAVPAGYKLVPVNPTPEMLASTSWPGCAGTDYAHMLAAAPAAPQAEPCIGNDPACPCQDGDACHYKDAADGTKAWPVPQAEPKREPNPDEVICPACTHQFRAIPENVQKQLWAKREPSLGELMREQRQSRIVAGAYPDGNPNAGAMMAQTRQAEPKRQPVSEATALIEWPESAKWKNRAAPEGIERSCMGEPKREPLNDERIAEIQRAAYERAAQECIETAAELRRCADGCTDGRYDWKADGADDCADAIRALGRQHD